MFPALEVPGEAVPAGSGLAADLQGNGMAVHQIDLGSFALLLETLLDLSAS